ncbi:MAG: CRTAC1 family protein [Planctomycetes bacterium]|nr:CRTAC1 family protein [Planctomycetota bacterium]
MNDRQPDEKVEYVAVDDRIIGVAFKWSMLVIVILAAIAVIIVLVLKTKAPEVVVENNSPVEPPKPLVQSSANRPEVRFTDITIEAGIGFVHNNGATGEKLLPETMGSGCAFLDYDNDSDQDIIFINAAPWPHNLIYDSPSPIALYRNDGSGKFENVTAQAGLNISLYGTGIACGDIDNDGDIDLFIAALGSNHLFINNDGVFTDVTTQAGVAGDESAWSTSAGFLDYDNDGLLDLFVCNYVRWSRDIDIKLNFTLNGTDRAYGPPLLYAGTNNTLYHNNGDGTFTDVTASAGIDVKNPATFEPMGKALATTFVDVDQDGNIDIVVANDTVQNFLLQNNGNGTFTEVGAVTGIAFDTMGSATGAMGIDAAIARNDGQLAVGIANFANEQSSLYVQQPGNPWQFADMSSVEGIGSPSRLKLSFGLFFFDYDLDGWVDLLQANGHLEQEINEIQSSQSYRQAPQLFWNCGPSAKACFAAVPESQLGDLATPIVGRSAAYADIDSDGDLDVLITQTGAGPLLLRNDQQTNHHWLRVKLVGTKVNADAIGAWVELSAGGIVQRKQVMPTRSYLSQVELPITFGLGDAETVESLKVLWPDGSEQSVQIVELDTTITVKQLIE